VLDPICEAIDQNLARDGNAALLARITWNGARQLVYRVNDPEIANAFLTRLFEEDPQRAMDYRMEPDPEWQLAETYLGPGRSIEAN